MSAILEPTPVTEAPAPELTVDQEIAALNAERSEELGEGPVSDQIDGEEQTIEEEYTEPEAPAADDEPVADEAAEDTDPEKKPEDGSEKAEPAIDDDAIIFDPKAETPETYAEKKAKVIESYGDNLPADIKSLLEYEQARAADLQTQVAELDAYGNKEAVIKTASAFGRAYDTEIVHGEAVLNPQPVVEHLLEDHQALVTPVAQRLFASDSRKYPGHTIFEEIMADQYGGDKVDAVVQFLESDAPLPTIAPELALPPVIAPDNKEAYFKLPEVKRFEIVSLAKNIEEKRAELADASEYYRSDIENEIKRDTERLNAELFAVDQIQANLNTTRERETREQRVAADNRKAFADTVNNTYNTEIFTMLDESAKVLAPALSFADDDTKLSHARNMLVRVTNALGFIINDDGTTSPDPMAEHYERQLREEKIAFDFAGGRELLKQHLAATRKLELLRQQRSDPQAIARAESAKNKIMFDIKTEQKQLLGMLGTKYAKSAGKALEKQVETIKGQKQFTKSITKGKPYTGGTGKPTMKTVDDEMAAFNRNQAAAIKDGDDLYGQYQ